MKRHALALLALTAVASFLLGLVAAGPGANAVPNLARGASPGTGAAASVAAPQTPAGPGLAVVAGAVDFAAVAARLNGAVVNVDTTARDTEDGSRPVLPRRWSDEVREGSGSGFVIDPAGLILTNYHVIYDATRVTVTLRDGRMFKASVVGVDPAIDVALLQVSAREPLPSAPLGHSAALRVGEWVCAIGNPLGYVHSVTVGVVSFLGRKVFDPSLDALIQTDAAITFGNSGGPLINAHGQVVGITTAISAQAANIGFAVPIDQVAAVLPQLRETGRVTRGDLGLGLTTVTPALQRALRLQPSRGALIQDVSENTPAERAGLRAYDVIVAADDQEIVSDDELNRFIAGRAPGVVTQLEIWRDGRTIRTPVKLTERPLPPSMRAMTAEAGKVRPAGRDGQLLGFSVIDLDAATVRRRNLPETLAGVVIASVDPAGPSRVMPIKSGQILLEINRERVTSVAHYRAIVAALRPGAPVALLIYDPASRQRLIQSIVTDPPS
jgi:serine protease Do